jgi:hypothetical protein
MDDPVANLRAGLDEDEAAANACQSPSPWKPSSHPSGSSVVDDAAGDPLIYNEGSPSLDEARHIARHDPARVLREVEAMRAILAAYETVLAECHTMLRDRRPRKYGEHDGLLLAVRHLAAIYSDQP